MNIEDLEWAAQWIESFEDMEGVPAVYSDSQEWDILTAKRVAAWLQREIDRRRSK